MVESASGCGLLPFPVRRQCAGPADCLPAAECREDREGVERVFIRVATFMITPGTAETLRP